MQEKKSQRSDLIYYMLYVTSITSSTAYKCPKCIQGEILLYIYIFLTIKRIMLHLGEKRTRGTLSSEVKLYILSCESLYNAHLYI